MRVFTKIDEIKQYIKQQKIKGKTIGFVPTMGYLHKGHLSLIRQAKQENDFIVVSIFVNPTQFGPGEDFEQYPRDLEKDTLLAEEAGADIIFNPDINELYPGGYQTYVQVEQLTQTLCGASRPVHFKGVTTIVTKLFNIITPDRAYFGQKDAQQSIVIQRMVEDLNMDVKIAVCPIIRENDGLAMSSRNVYLNQEERKQATVLYQSLTAATGVIVNGERNAGKIKAMIETMIADKPLAKIDYISVVDGKTLEDIRDIETQVLIALAVRFGETRLIDNVIVEG